MSHNLLSSDALLVKGLCDLSLNGLLAVDPKPILDAVLALQVRALKAGADVVVATPGRLEDLVSEGSCRLQGVTYLVLDEADRMLDLGFEPHIRRVCGFTSFACHSPVLGNPPPPPPPPPLLG